MRTLPKALAAAVIAVLALAAMSAGTTARPNTGCRRQATEPKVGAPAVS